MENSKAKELYENGKYQSALEILLADKNPDPETEGLIGLCYHKLKDFYMAQLYLTKSIVKKYDKKVAKALYTTLKENQDESALLGLELLMYENNKEDIELLKEITILAGKLKQYDLAIEFYNILLKLKKNDYVAWNNLGLIYEETGKWQQAYDCYKKSLALKDFFSPNFNLSIVSRKLHKFDEAVNYMKKAITQNPNSPQPKYSLAMTYLMLKDFKKGYPLYSNHMSVIMPEYFKNEWKDNTPHPDKTLCIFATGGLGDNIMFSRYFKYLKDYFKKIYMLVPKNLMRLIKYNFPYIEPIDSSVYFTDYDYAITPMHILKIFDLDFTKSVPDSDKFLDAPNDLAEKFNEKYFRHNKLKIGINWHGNREGTRTFFNRSMPIEALEPVFEKFKNSAIFYSVQKDESYKECLKYENVVNLYDDINDFLDTCAILKNLDFLISIDSSPVHAAGGLGVRTNVLLPYANEWRWFIDDKESIWYKSVKLYRQDTEGDWSSAVNKMLNDL